MRKKKLGTSAFSPDQTRFSVMEAARYCGYSTRSSFMRHVKRGSILPEPPRRDSSELVFSRERLDAFLENKIKASDEFPPDQTKFTTDEAWRYCRYATKTGFTHHIYETGLVKPDEVYTSGNKALLLIFYRKTLDKFMEKRKAMKPGPYNNQ
jgi:hypothetical protein